MTTAKESKASDKQVAAKQEAEKAAETEEEAPEMPPMPKLSLSQFMPMIVMIGLNKYNLDEMGYRTWVEIAFVLVQLACLGVLAYLHTRISAMPDTGAKIDIPEVTQLGQVVKPATKQTAKEYDSEKLREQVKQTVMTCVILGGIYYKWQSLLPMVLQVLMTPLRLFETQLVKIHVFGHTVARPFPAESPFGLPTQPEEKKAKAD